MKLLGFRVFIALCIASVMLVPIAAVTLGAIGEQKISALEFPFDIAHYGDDYSRIDRNSDGRVDYVAKSERGGAKSFEAMDFNNDGFLDDFYIYEKGSLVRREVDSNFDLKIDLWLYLYEGTYVEAYERDVDFNGTIDVVKSFAKKTASTRP